VLTVDFHLDGNRFVSAGMDNAIKVWSLDQCEAAIEKAETFDLNAPPSSSSSSSLGVKGKAKGNKAQSHASSSSASHKPADSKSVASQAAGGKGGVGEGEVSESSAPDHASLPAAGLQAAGKFRSSIVQMPMFSTARIHRNYVDCVRWCGDLLLTKSTHNKVAVWKPAPSKGAGQDAALVIGELLYSNSDIWFLRFNIDPAHSFMALGNKVGQIYLWDLTKGGGGRETLKLSHSQCTSTIRQTAISADSRTILAVTDDASVWRWDASR